jgi:hypothetical protein
MIGDYMTKPLHSKKFEKFQQSIMNLPCVTQLLMVACVAECVQNDVRVFLPWMVFTQRKS